MSLPSPRSEADSKLITNKYILSHQIKQMGLRRWGKAILETEFREDLSEEVIFKQRAQGKRQNYRDVWESVSHTEGTSAKALRLECA